MSCRVAAKADPNRSNPLKLNFDTYEADPSLERVKTAFRAILKLRRGPIARAAVIQANGFIGRAELPLRLILTV